MYVEMYIQMVFKMYVEMYFEMYVVMYFEVYFDMYFVMYVEMYCNLVQLHLPKRMTIFQVILAQDANWFKNNFVFLFSILRDAKCCW